MSDLLARAGAVFVAPAPAAAPRAAAASPPPAGLVAVLARPEDLAAVAGGVAAGLRHRHRARTALVLLPAHQAGEGVALPAARALARRLAARDLPATAAGALVRVALSADGEAAVRESWRAIAGAVGAPVVIGLAARDDRLDRLLADADALLLAPPPDAGDAFAALALASLAALGPPASLVVTPRGFAARRLAAVGLARAGALQEIAA